MTLCPEVALPQRCMPSVSGASGGTPAGTRGKAEGREPFSVPMHTADSVEK